MDLIDVLWDDVLDYKLGHRPTRKTCSWDYGKQRRVKGHEHSTRPSSAIGAPGVLIGRDGLVDDDQ